MTNVQVLAQFVTSLNKMASEVMRVAFDGGGAVCVTITQSPSSGTLHDGNGVVAPYERTSATGSSAGVVLQFVHGMCGLFSGPAELRTVTSMTVPACSGGVYTNDNF